MPVYKIWWSEKVSYCAYVEANSPDMAIEMQNIVRDVEIVDSSNMKDITAELVCEGDLCDCNCGSIGIIINIGDDGNMLVSCPKCAAGNVESAIKERLEHRSQRFC